MEVSVSSSAKRPLVLVFVRHYLPGFRAGGPVRTLSNMVARLGGDFDFRIVTLDRDFGDVAPFSGFAARGWSALGNAMVIYLSPEAVSVRSVAQIIQELKPHCVYLNGCFDPCFTQRVLWARRFGLIGDAKVVLAPRGEFSESALRIKAAKKKIYIWLTRFFGFYCGLRWHVSSSQERDDLVAVLPFLSQRNIRVALNLAPDTSTSCEVVRCPRPANHALRVCFLGRIAPMKNLDFALKVLAQVKCEVVFTVYGPLESESYWAECKALIDRLPDNVRVSYDGQLRPEVVKKTLAKHDLFFFPTRGENYGHVIHEALASGLPVLISDRTPWAKVEGAEVGWCVSLSAASNFVQIIQDVAKWTEFEHVRVRRLAMAFAAEGAADVDTLERNRSVFCFDD